MPTYEYECSHCGHRFEIFQSITAKPLENCPKCQKELKRLIGGGGGFIFKGSGFYATDYAKKPDNPPKSGKTTCPMAKEGCKACQ